MDRPSTDSSDPLGRGRSLPASCPPRRAHRDPPSHRASEHPPVGLDARARWQGEVVDFRWEL